MAAIFTLQKVETCSQVKVILLILDVEIWLKRQSLRTSIFTQGFAIVFIDDLTLAFTRAELFKGAASALIDQSTALSQILTDHRR